MTDRERFEAWAVSKHFAIHRNGGEQYVNTATHHAWAGWQASRKQTLEEVAQDAEGSAEWYMEQAQGGDNSGASDHCADALVVFAGEIRTLATPEGEQG